MAETTYCDDYEAIVGPKPTLETKVVSAPEKATPAPAAVAETK